MINLKQHSKKIVYPALLSFLLLGACDERNTGSNSTEDWENSTLDSSSEQMSNSPNTYDNNNNMDNNVGKMNNDGEFVVIRNFNEQDWNTVRSQNNLQDVNEPTMGQYTTQNSAASSWKSMGDYKYRVIYYSQNGELRAKPLLRTQDDQEIPMSSNTVDSLGVQDIWSDIQQSTSRISGNSNNNN